MNTLPDPRHEAFSRLLASGHDFPSAYVHAGYSVKNIKTRSRQLASHPAIRARVAHLQKCLPEINDLQQHFAPSLRLMPETQDQMLAWLWQVMNGTRKVLPLQLRAATLFCRLKGWHLTKPLPAEQQPQPKAAHLTDLEQTLLAGLNRQNIAQELTGLPTPTGAIDQFRSQMADLDLIAYFDSPQTRPYPQPIPESELPNLLPTPKPAPPPIPPTEIAHLEDRLTSLETEITTHLTLHRHPPITSPKPPNGEPTSPPQSIDPQPFIPLNPQMGKKSTPHPLPPTLYPHKKTAS
ncbi:hypothetical protein EI77_00176 [Prosthecobacter fusiformis]|uniref:Terminase small subunit n=1 Tax=Prosthecobacter fusiformis TaxID=48464 RepID=A0A4R7SR26_9BACT|nr:hypothetical protein [Prosthecobacter fusiformis]TDU80876.1 hypothetical protein EI77_00176 [Prosthecobacter fusiformis]